MADLESLHVDVARLEEQVVGLTYRIDGLVASVDKLNGTLAAHIGAEDQSNGIQSNRITILEQAKIDADAAAVRKQNWLLGFLGAAAVIIGVIVEHVRLSFGK